MDVYMYGLYVWQVCMYEMVCKEGMYVWDVRDVCMGCKGCMY